MPSPPPRVERVAHRGMPLERVENTMAGFQLAIARGADAVELDTHTTKDGVVIVHHDEAVATRPIASTAWRDLENVVVGIDGRIPRLDDVLDAVADRATVYIELKGSFIEDAVIAVARRHGRRFALHSFDHEAIARVASSAPDLARGILIDRDTSDVVDVMRRTVERTRPRDVWPHWSLVDEVFMRVARSLEVRVIPWTVNTTVAARRLAQLKVDGICSDDVQLLATL